MYHSSSKESCQKSDEVDPNEGKIEVNLGLLDPPSKSRAWAWVKENQPAVAEFLLSDQFKMMQEHFECAPVIHLTDDEFFSLKLRKNY